MKAARIGIDLGGTKIEAVLLDAGGAVRFRERVATPKGDYAATVAAVAALVERIDVEFGGGSPVGIGTPGAWAPERRQMKNCNSTWLNGQPLLDDLNAALDGRVRIANDANCFALAEAEGVDAQVVFGVILGTGVGGGIVVGGQLLAGANAIAGEWGHTPLPYLRADPAADGREGSLADRPCYCGRTNCVETFLSGPGLARTHEAFTGEELDGPVPTDSPALDLYTTMLARSLAQIVNVLDPDVIVLGGGVSNLDVLYREVPRKLPRYVFTHEGRTRIVRARFGDSAGVFGAARIGWLKGRASRVTKAPHGSPYNRSCGSTERLD